MVVTTAISFPLTTVLHSYEIAVIMLFPELSRSKVTKINIKQT
jgi:hypothetical protein